MVDYEFVRKTNALGVFLFIPFSSLLAFSSSFLFGAHTHTWNLGGGMPVFFASLFSRKVTCILSTWLFFHDGFSGLSGEAASREVHRVVVCC